MSDPFFTIDPEFQGMVEPGNIDLRTRPSVKNPEGGTSSVYSMSVGFDDGEYLIPRVSDDGRILSEDEAVELFKKSGNHLGKFANPDAATQYAGKLHEQQAASTDFSSMLKNALKDERFNALDSSGRQQVLWKLMDKDPRTAELDDQARSKLINKTFSIIRERFDQEQKDFEQANRPSSKASEALRNPILNQVTAGASGSVADFLQGSDTAAGAVDAITDAPHVRDALSAARSLVGGAAAAAEGVTQQIPLLRRMMNPNASLDGEAGQREATPSEVGTQLVMRSMRTALEQSIPQSDKLVRSWDQVDGPYRFLEWALGNTADSIAYLTPVLATALITKNPAISSTVMGAQFAGENAMGQIEEGGTFDPVVSNAVATASTVLEQAFGPGSAMSKAPMSFIRKLANMSGKDVVKDIIKGGVGEMTTELIQQYIDEQSSEWSGGDIGFWNNLEPEEKGGLAEAAALGFFMGGMFEGGRAVKTSASGAPRRAKALLDKIDAVGMTPEQRGEKGILSVLTRPDSMTEEEEQEIRHSVTGDLTFLDEEQLGQFVTGQPVQGEFTEEQQELLDEAQTRAKNRVEGQDLTPVEYSGRSVTRALKGIKDNIMKQAAKAERDGKPTLAAAKRRAAETLHAVEINDDAWTELVAHAKKEHGIELVAYDSDGSVGVGGLLAEKGLVMVRAQKRADLAMLGIIHHEATHNLQYVNPAAHRTLVNFITENFPTEWEAAGKAIDKGIDQGVYPEDITNEKREGEQLAFFMEGRDLSQDSQLKGGRTRLIMQMYQHYEELSKKAEQPRGVRKFLEWVRKAIYKLAEKSKFVRDLTGITPQDSNEEVQRKVYEFAKMSVDLFRETKAKADEAGVAVDLGEKTQIPRPVGRDEQGNQVSAPPNSQAVTLGSLQPGDVIVHARTQGRPATVMTAQVSQLGSATSAIIRVETNDGQSIDIVEKPSGLVYKIRRQNAPESAPKAETSEKPQKPAKKKGTPKAQSPAVESTDPDIEIEIIDDPGLLPDRLTAEELRKVRETDYYKNALRNATEGNWEEIDPVRYHKALNANVAAVTLTPYSLEDLKSPEFRLFKLKGAEIYFAMKGKDAVGGVNNDMSRLPGIASDAYMIKAIEEGAETGDFFNVIPPGKDMGFLQERYFRWGFRAARTEEMPQWAQDAGGKHGVLPFSEEAYLEEHTKEDLATARQYWKEMGGVGDPHVVFMVWDPPAGVTRTNLRRKWRQGKIGTHEVAIEQAYGDKALKPIEDELMATTTFQKVTEEDYKGAGGGFESGTVKGKRVDYWFIYDDKWQAQPKRGTNAPFSTVEPGDWIKSSEIERFKKVKSIRPSFHEAMAQEGYLDVTYEDGTIEMFLPGDRIVRADAEGVGPLRIGKMIIRQRFIGTEDHDLYYEWIDTFDSPDQKMKGKKGQEDHTEGGLGMRGTLALRMLLQGHYPGALWVTGYRAGGAHQFAARKGKDHDPNIRRPLYTDKQMERMGITLPPNRTEEELGAIHGYDAVEGYDYDDVEQAATGPTDEQLDSDLETYDDQILEEGVQFHEESDEIMDAWIEQKEHDDTYGDFASMLPSDPGATAPEEMQKWGTKEWRKWGRKYDIPNVAGISKLEKVGKVQVPGGTEGTWTFEELMWMQAQAWNPEDAWTEEQHVAIQKKLSRTLTPKKGDNLQVLNQLVFAMLSPGFNLTMNEITYALHRMPTEEHVKERAAMIPWDVTKGEVPSREIFDRLSDDEKQEMTDWLKKHKKIDVPTLNDSALAKAMRMFYNNKIHTTFGTASKDQEGLGLVGQGQSTYVSELAQIYLADPGWLALRDGESWYVYAERLSSQLGGLGIKVAAFGAVWQDPLNAMISAVDRHMAFIHRDAILGDAESRTKFETKALKKWRELKGKDAKAQSIDDITQERGGTGFITELLMADLGAAKTPVYSKEKHAEYGEFIKDPKKLTLMSAAYKRALEYNMQEAARLGLGMFATQHLQWDRQRQRFETHFMMFPGLYKAPRLNADEVANHLQRMKDLGWAKTDKETVTKKDGTTEERLKRPRPAPPGSLALAATSPPPSAFERGTRLRSSVVDAAVSHPSAVVNNGSGPLWLIPDTVWWQRARIKFQDKFLRVMHLQKAVERWGGHITDPTDVYMHELLYHGRVAAAVETFDREFVEPLLEKIRKDGIDINEFEEWLEARHTEERNDHLDDIWYTRRLERLEGEAQVIAEEIDLAEQEEGFDDTVLRRRYQRKMRQIKQLKEKKANNELPIAGMTNAEAGRVLAQAGDKFDEVAKLFDSMMDQKLQILFEAGLISEEEMEKVSIYKYYVPLKGKEYDGDLEILLDDIGAGTGSGFDIRGDELGVSMGRIGGSRATHPIISQAVVDIEDAIVRVEKNVVGQAMLAFVEEFKNPNLYEVNKVVGRRVWDAKNKEAKVVRDKWGKKAPNVLAVKRDGETFYIHIKDARLAMALKNIGSPNHGTVVKIFAAANRLMAKLNTTLNPEFMVSNFIRDLQTALVHLGDKEAQGIAQKTMAGIIPAMRGIAAGEFEHISDTEWTQWYERFMKAGGKIGFFGYNDVLSKAKAIDRRIKRQGPGAKRMTMRTVMAMGSLVERGNAVVENGVRLASFRAAVEAGMSEKKAASLARRLTVNFNKKGEAGSFMNALWLFSNASLQGTARMFQALGRSRRVQGMALSQVMFSFILAMLNRAYGGDDDEDGYSYWEKLPEWQKETNTIIMLPGTKGDHIKIPLPYGYNVFSVLGVQAEKIFHKIHSGQAKPEDAWEAGVSVADSLLGAFNPLGSTRLDSSWGLLRFAVPSIFSPVADTLVNETYYGAPIMPVRSSWDRSPDSQRYFRSVSTLSRELTDWANGVTGGNHYQPGAVDVNPEILDYLIGSYSGAGAKTAKRILFDGPAWLFKGQHDLSKIEARDVAFLRRIYGEENDYTVSAIFYENIEEIEQADDAWTKLAKDPRFDKGEWKEKHGWKLKVVDAAKRATKKIAKAETQEEKDKARKEFNRAYREAWESQF